MPDVTRDALATPAVPAPPDLPPAPTSRRVSVLQLLPAFAWLIAVCVLLYFFNALSSVLLGVLAAATIACTLDPLAKAVPGPRGLAAAVLGLSLIALAGGLLVALSWPLAEPIRREWHHWPETQQRVNSFLEQWSRQLGVSDVPTTDELLLAQKRAAAAKGVGSADRLTDADLRDVEQQVRAEKRLTVNKLLENLGSFLAGEGGERLFSRSTDVMFGILVWIIFIFFGSMFLLAEPRDKLLGPALSLASPRHRPALRRLADELGPKLRRWALGTGIGMGVVFVASIVGYSIVGLQFAVPLALLAGLCEVVPTVGPAVACLVACLIAAATARGGTVVGVLCVYGVVQMLEAYLILPMIMRGAVKIHPAVTLFSVILWGKIFGVPGLMLAIPINLTLWGAADQFLIRRPHPPHQPLPAAAASSRGPSRMPEESDGRNPAAAPAIP